MTIESKLVTIQKKLEHLSLTQNELRYGHVAMIIVLNSMIVIIEKMALKQTNFKLVELFINPCYIENAKRKALKFPQDWSE